jgi:AraC-like DNA-binding protein
VNYDEYRPHPLLRPFVRTYWSLCGNSGESLPQPVVPDGTTELIVHRECTFTRYSDVGSIRQSSMLFVGPMISPVLLVPGGTIEVVAVRFRPNGAFALTGVPQHQLQDAIVDLGSLQVPWLLQVARDARQATSIPSAIAAIEAGLLDRADKAIGRLDARVDAVVRLIDQRGGAVRIDGVTPIGGTGRRHLERLFRECVGLTPKGLARIVRFNAAAARVSKRRDDALTVVSDETGYFDQAHMTREFLAFSGRTPQQFRSRLGELTRIMLAGAEL